MIPWLFRLAAAALALVAPLTAAPAQETGQRPSEPAAIVAAAQSCNAALTPERLDDARLVADGWTVATLSGEGRDGEAGLRFFGRDSILLLSMPANPSCMIMARLRSRDDYGRLVEALTAAFGTPAHTEASGSNMWVLPDNRAMQIDPTGNRERPSARLAIIYSTSGSDRDPG